MGQMTHGVLFGAKIENLNDEDDELYSDLDDELSRIGAYLAYIDAEKPYHLAGFWLAVGASGRDGVPFLATVQVSAIPVTYSERYDAAVDGWSRVVAAVAAAGVKDFGPPDFWIAETEVA